MKTPFFKLLVVFILGFSSGLPMALLSSTLIAWYSSYHLSVISVASLSMLGLAYVLRILWSPVVDRYFLSWIGRRRFWLLLTQSLLIIGFNVLAWGSPASYPFSIATLALFLAITSATQDAVIDAHRTEYLTPRWHALGASLAVAAYRLALIISGGVALIMAQKWGWGRMFQCMSLCLLPALMVSWMSQEPQHPVQPQYGLSHAFLQPLQELWQRPYLSTLLVFIVLFKLGEAFTTNTSGIVMPFLIQGLGFPLDTIAYVNKFLGVIAIIAGGLIAGVILLYVSLYRALLWFGLLQALTNVLFAILASVGANLNWLVAAVVMDNLAAGLGTTALIALFMRLTDKQYTATQFSLFVAVSTIPRVFTGPFAGWLQVKIGWVGLYQLSVLFALLFIPFLFALVRDISSERLHDKTLPLQEELG